MIWFVTVICAVGAMLAFGFLVPWTRPLVLRLFRSLRRRPKLAPAEKCTICGRVGALEKRPRVVSEVVMDDSDKRRRFLTRVYYLVPGDDPCCQPCLKLESGEWERRIATRDADLAAEVSHLENGGMLSWAQADVRRASDEVAAKHSPAPSFPALPPASAPVVVDTVGVSPPPPSSKEEEAP